MKAPLIFCSTSHAINVQKIFKIVLSKAFDLKCAFNPILAHTVLTCVMLPPGTIPEITEVGEPLLIYREV